MMVRGHLDELGIDAFAEQTFLWSKLLFPLILEQTFLWSKLLTPLILEQTLCSSFEYLVDVAKGCSRKMKQYTGLESVSLKRRGQYAFKGTFPVQRISATFERAYEDHSRATKLSYSSFIDWQRNDAIYSLDLHRLIVRNVLAGRNLCSVFDAHTRGRRGQRDIR